MMTDWIVAIAAVVSVAAAAVAILVNHHQQKTRRTIDAVFAWVSSETLTQAKKSVREYRKRANSDVDRGDEFADADAAYRDAIQILNYLDIICHGVEEKIYSERLIYRIMHRVIRDSSKILDHPVLGEGLSSDSFPALYRIKARFALKKDWNSRS